MLNRARAAFPSAAAALAVVFCTHVVRAAVPSGRAAMPPDRHSPNQDIAAEVGTYPTKPVRLIEPFGAGGGPDVVARAVGARLSELWHQPVIVENHPGAGSTAAPALVAKAPADGYTLLVNTSAQAYSAVITRKLSYGPLRDFIAIAPLTSQPYVLIVGPHAGIRTVAELIAAAKAAPNKLRFASTGQGTGTHLGVVKLNLEAGIQAVHLPAREDQAIADVIASTAEGRADYQMAPIPLAVADIRAGKLLALGVSGTQRSPLLPEVPTIAEAGVPGFDFPIWYGVWAPAGTPVELIEKLSKDIARVLAVPGLRASLATHGAEPMTMTQPAFARFVLDQSQAAARLIRAAGVPQ